MVTVQYFQWRLAFAVPTLVVNALVGDFTGVRVPFEHEDCPIRKDILPNFDALFYEPFYQFMRQQLLAHEMEKAHELDAELVTVLHIAPAHNSNFCRVTSPQLINLGETATSVWRKLVKPGGRFISVSTEQLFGNVSVERFPEIKTWVDYIRARYTWLWA